MPPPPTLAHSVSTPANPPRAAHSGRSRLARSVIVRLAGVLGVLALGALAATAAMRGEDRADTLQPVLAAVAPATPQTAHEPTPVPSAAPTAPPQPQPQPQPREALKKKKKKKKKKRVAVVEPTLEPEPEPKPEPKPMLTRAPIPPPRGAGRQAWLGYADRLEQRRAARFESAQAVAETRTERAALEHSGVPISDEFGRAVGAQRYPDEEATKLGLRLNAIVDPVGREPFAIIEDQGTGVVASYREGTVLAPGVLPGVWVVDVEPGVVHLLDLEADSFAYLTFEKPAKLSPAARRAKRRRDRAKRRARRSRSK